MKVVRNSSKPKRKEKKKKRRRRLKPSFVAVLFLLVISVVMALSLTVWFNIEQINCVGESIYTEKEIIAASGLTVGNNLIILPTATIEERIVTTLPYIKTAKVKRLLPDSVVIEVTPDTEVYGVKADDGYLVVDDNYKVLNTLTDKPDLRIIKGVNTENAFAGRNLFENDSEKKELFEEINNLVNNSKINATVVNLENSVELQIVIEDRVVVLLGNTENLESKLTLALALFDESNDSYISPAETGIINLEYWSKTNNQAIFKKCEIKDYL